MYSMNGIKAGASMIVKLANSICKEQVAKAQKILQNGGIVALPTDTLYGLAAKVDNSSAIQKIYDIKSRDFGKPLAVCSPDIETIKQISHTEHVDDSLLNSLLPGPVTLLFNRKTSLNFDLNPGITLVGIRIPKNEFIRSLCKLTGPLALTSANKSEQLSPLAVEDFEEIWHRIDTVFDGGFLAFDKDRLGSTVVDLTQPNHYKIVREGCALQQTIAILEKYNLRPNRY